MLGGKTKYLVNGKTETQQEVSNMFQSVQLNIQNPNFLIMQGKITHVLNMKPQQILGMVEEAAGTRLYEDRKEKAIKVMEKKDLKLAQSTMVKRSGFYYMTDYLFPSFLRRKYLPNWTNCAKKSAPCWNINRFLRKWSN